MSLRKQDAQNEHARRVLNFTCCRCLLRRCWSSELASCCRSFISDGCWAGCARQRALRPLRDLPSRPTRVPVRTGVIASQARAQATDSSTVSSSDERPATLRLATARPRLIMCQVGAGRAARGASRGARDVLRRMYTLTGAADISRPRQTKIRLLGSKLRGLSPNVADSASPVLLPL